MIFNQGCAYLPVDDGVNDAPVDDAIAERQVARSIARRAEVQVVVAAAGRPEVHHPVVDDGVRGVLDLDGEALRDGVGRRVPGDVARQGSGQCTQENSER